VSVEHFSDSVPGWFDWPETYARWAREVPDGGVIVEVGVFCGRSLSYLAVEALNAGKAVQLHAVDTWGGSPELMQFAAVRDGSFYEDGWRQTYDRLLEMGASVWEHRGDSVLMSEDFADGTVDRVWLDGDHSTEGALADMLAWWPKVKPGGEMGGHDYGQFGVVDAIERFAHRHGLAIEVMKPSPLADRSPGVSRSWLVRKAAPVTAWTVPDGERSVLICPVSNHLAQPRQSMASLLYMAFHAKASAASVGFDSDVHWESGAFTLDTLRDRAIYHAICNRYSHILFLDTDNVWPHDLPAKLLPWHPLGIVSGLYHMKQAPHEGVALTDAPDDPNPNMYRKMPFVHEATEPVEVDVLGMGCTLIPVALCKQMPRPWFKFQYDEYGWNGVTEDVWFCQQAKRHGARLWVDPTLNVGHVRQSIVGVNDYEPHVAMVAKAHREKARRAADRVRQGRDMAWMASLGLDHRDPAAKRQAMVTRLLQEDQA
jgi:hypothetical protein